MSKHFEESSEVIRPKYSGKLEFRRIKVGSNRFNMFCTHQAHCRERGVPIYKIFLARGCFFVIFGWVLVRIFFSFWGAPKISGLRVKFQGLFYPPFHRNSPQCYRGLILMWSTHMILIRICLMFFFMCTHQAHSVSCHFFQGQIFPKIIFTHGPPFSRVCLMCANHVKSIRDNFYTPELKFP